MNLRENQNLGNELDKYQEMENEEIQNFVNEVLRPLFPKLNLSSRMTFKGVNTKANTFVGKASKSAIFEETPYQYTGTDQFLHFTSLNSLNSILDCGWLRMSEFRNLSDKNELLFAASEVFDIDFPNFFKGDVDSNKSNLFCLSACDASHENRTDHHLWNFYGDEGKGVSIEYEFSNIDVHNYLFGNILYGIENLDLIKKVMLNYRSYLSSNRGICPSNFVQLMTVILVFHKEAHFKSEKEVRLFWESYKAQWEVHDNYFIYEDFNSCQEVRYFAKLFLKERNPFFENREVSDLRKKEMLEVIPQVEIKKITLGNNISIENKLEIFDLLHKIKRKHDYEYEILHMRDGNVVPFI
ncbi:hypothetical protein [Aquirufa sp. Wall-65K1]